MRTYDVTVVEKALEQVKDDLKGQPVSDWLAFSDNVALTNLDGDVALFEIRQKGVYTGHYFFHSRGAKAVKVARQFLSEFFTSHGSVIIGMTPLDKKGAVWMSHHLGFTPVEDVELDGRPHRIFVMTRKDYEQPSRR